jgi:acyl-CoA thioesterase
MARLDPSLNASSPATAWANVEVASSGSGEATLEMAARPEMANQVGVVHGGFIALLADTAMARALRTVLASERRQLSFDLKISYVATGRVGERLRAAARVLHAGRRTGVCQCRVEGDDGRLVATATATFFISRPEGNSS